MGRGGAREGAGKKPGTRDRATIEAELAAAKQELEQRTRRDERGHKLAVEVLNDIMHVAYGMMAKHQPLAPNEAPAPGREANLVEFKEWMRITVDTAKELAPYQSSKFKAVSLSIEKPIGGETVPENPNAPGQQVMSPAEAYRRLRDHDIIDLTPTSVVERPAPANVAKLPRPKKQAKG